MAHTTILKTVIDDRGILTVIEKLPFDIKRVFYIYGCNDFARGGHRHRKTIQAAVCIQGECKIFVDDGRQHKQTFNLDNPLICLILETWDWHEMYDFSKDAILMVFASENFNKDDYIAEKYGV